MNLSSISKINFKSRLPKLEEGLYPSKLEKSPKSDEFKKATADKNNETKSVNDGYVVPINLIFNIPNGYVEQKSTKGYHVEFTPDNRQILVSDLIK